MYNYVDSRIYVVETYKLENPPNLNVPSSPTINYIFVNILKFNSMYKVIKE